MKKTPLVSINLPCYNAEKTIKETILSVLQQTYTNWELIIIDDGSKDKSAEIIALFSDDRFKIYSDGTNKGCPARLKEGVSYAQGKYLARIDSDDLMFPDRLEKQVAYLEENPGIDIVGGGLVSIDDKFSLRGLRIPPEKVTDPYLIFKGEVLYHPAVMGRTEWFKAHPYLPEYLFSDDYALWCSSASDLKIANLQEPVIFYREHEVFTFRKYKGRAADIKNVIKKFGPEKIGASKTFFLLARRFIKDSIYLFLYVAGFWNYTYKLYNKGIDQALMGKYRDVLDGLLQNVE